MGTHIALRIGFLLEEGPDITRDAGAFPWNGDDITAQCSFLSVAR